jgi:hypothetical protein
MVKRAKKRTTRKKTLKRESISQSVLDTRKILNNPKDKDLLKFVFD